MIDDCYINNLTKNQVSAVFHSLVICRSVSPKFIELCMETPCLCRSEGHKHGDRKITKTCRSVLPLKRKFLLELQRIEINASSSASTVYLAKTKAITHLLTYATVFVGHHFHVTQLWQKLGVFYYKKNSVELKDRQTSHSCRVFYLMKLKPQKER